MEFIFSKMEISFVKGSIFVNKFKISIICNIYIICNNICGI